MGSLDDDICEYGDGGDSDDDCQVLKKIQFHKVLIAIVCKKIISVPSLFLVYLMIEVYV